MTQHTHKIPPPVPKNDGHRVKVRGATKRHSRVQGSAHDSKESEAAQRGGKKGPQMKGTKIEAAGESRTKRDHTHSVVKKAVSTRTHKHTRYPYNGTSCISRRRLVHTARKSHQPRIGGYGWSPPKSQLPPVPKMMATV